MARMVPPARTLRPLVEPWNHGIHEVKGFDCTAGANEFLIQGTITTYAHNPYTIEGIAAIISTIMRNEVLILGGQNSLKNTAAPIPKGIAIAIAKNVHMNDPTMNNPIP
jgi:hypothetical protein